ncbi:MAG TPA: phosphate ABC transporter substrate-binding protein PstS [Tepidisphaeraceae bacterium]|nr:phosphate ABC transporter substrate-binding protein PstS [Tepidisphaeraceae bacterium]
MNLITKLAATAALTLGSAIAAAEVRLQGAGATFPQPLYERWVGEYQKAHPDVKIDYQGIGSGGGINAITEKTVDFAGSDAPLSKKEIEALGGEAKVVEVPSCSGGVVPAYNVPGVKEELKFTGPVLADIYLGTISKWNDPRIAQLNPGISLPDAPITPVWRTDGSGTNFVWTNYLATQSQDFRNNIGVGKQVKWPLGQGGKGNPGVAQVVQQTGGAIGYLEQNYADKNNIPYGSVQNKSGKFVKASPQAISLAGEGAVNEMKGSVVHANMWNQEGEGAYPIASFTYLIVYKDLDNLKTPRQAQSLVDFMWWATHDGEKLATDLDYAPLSEGVQKKVEAALKTITYKGEKLNTPQGVASK